MTAAAHHRARRPRAPTRHPAFQERVSGYQADPQRRLYDAFHPEIRYDCLDHELILRVSIDAETAAPPPATIHAMTSIPAPRRPPVTQETGTRANAPAPGQAVRDVLRAPVGRVIDPQQTAVRVVADRNGGVSLVICARLCRLSRSWSTTVLGTDRSH
jgi:hypothetical protein